MAHRLLRASERHALLGPIGLGLVLFLLAQGLLILFFGGIPHDLVTLIAVEVVLLLAGASVPLLLVTIAFGSAFVQVAEISRTARNPDRIFVIVRHYLLTSLGVMKEQLQCLQSGEGLSLAIAEMDEVAGWIPTFFSSAEGKYVGFDSSVPSYYLQRWDGYVRYLQEYEPGVRLRVITSPEDALLADIDAHPESAKRLQEVHDKMEADLVCLDERRVRKLAEKHKLPSSSVVDLALWEDDYCLLWERGEDRFTVRLALTEGPNYRRVRSFIADVEAEAKPLKALLPVHEQVTLTDPDLV
jgi:hypothetical protein